MTQNLLLVALLAALCVLVLGLVALYRRWALAKYLWQTRSETPFAETRKELKVLLERTRAVRSKTPPGSEEWLELDANEVWLTDALRGRSEQTYGPHAPLSTAWVQRNIEKAEENHSGSTKTQDEILALVKRIDYMLEYAAEGSADHAELERTRGWLFEILSRGRTPRDLRNLFERNQGRYRTQITLENAAQRLR